MTRFAIAALLLACPAFAADEKESPLMAKLRKAGIKGEFTLIVSMQAKEGEEKALIAACAPCIAATLKEKGCLAYDLVRDLDAPTKFVLYERWKSPAALAAHMKEEHTKKLL